MLQGEDEWEAQLVADSEILDQAHLQNPMHSDDEQPWPEPLSPLSRDIERGRRQLLESEEEDIWEEDPEDPGELTFRQTMKTSCNNLIYVTKYLY